MISVSEDRPSVNPLLAEKVRQAAADCIGNPTRRTARSSRSEYIRRIFTASLSGDDIDREADEWLATLRELCGPFAHIEDISRWYEIETERLLKLAGH